MKQTNIHLSLQVALITISILLPFCSSKKTEARLVLTNITESVYASGILKSTNQYEVFSPVNGIIQDILVSEGDSVGKDEPIMTIVSERAQLELENAKLTLDHSLMSSNRNKLAELASNLEFLKARMKNDSLLYEKQQKLWAEGIGTRNELELKELTLKNDVSNYQATLFRYNDLQKEISFNAGQAKNNLEISKTNTRDFLIKSKIQGRIYAIMKEKGEMINTQNPVAIIGNKNNYCLELQVDEYDIAGIKRGQMVFISMDSYKDKIFNAVIARIIPYMNERTRSFTVEAVFADAPEIIYPNQNVEANIVIQTKNSALTIPRGYLLHDSLVVLKNGEKRKVVTGLMDYQKAEIISGLSPTDIIITPTQ